MTEAARHSLTTRSPSDNPGRHPQRRPGPRCGNQATAQGLQTLQTYSKHGIIRRATNTTLDSPCRCCRLFGGESDPQKPTSWATRRIPCTGRQGLRRTSGPCMFLQFLEGNGAHMARDFEHAWVGGFEGPLGICQVGETSSTQAVQGPGVADVIHLQPHARPPPAAYVQGPGLIHS